MPHGSSASWPIATRSQLRDAAVIIGEARIESTLQDAADGFDVAGASRCEHALAGGVDMGFECLPARKAVVARDRELGFGGLGTRLLRRQCLKALLRFVLQMFGRSNLTWRLAAPAATGLGN
jgi:hypothetical protein